MNTKCKFLRLFLIVLFFCCKALVYGQKENSFKGSVRNFTNSSLSLVLYNGTQDTVYYECETDGQGNFTLKYPESYTGAAMLQCKDAGSFIILLNNESFEMNVGNIADVNTVVFNNSTENEYLHQVYLLYQETAKKLAGLRYLKPIYTEQTKQDADFLAKIDDQININQKKYSSFLQTIDSGLYVFKYCTYRKLLDNLNAQNITNKQFNDLRTAIHNVDFSDKDFYHSGLVVPILEKYFEICYIQNKDKRLLTAKINETVDYIIASTENEPEILDNYSIFLFKWFEKYGFTDCAAHMSDKLLDDAKCRLSNFLTDLLEQYRKMAVGNIAPDVTLPLKIKKLENNEYRLLVFGASTCPYCLEDLPLLSAKAGELSAKYNTEIVFISLDTDKESYKNFVKQFDFISYCDFEGWESDIAKQFYISSTPSYFLLDHNNVIIAKPHNINDFVSNMKIYP